MNNSYLYTGKPIIPKLSLKVGDKQLEPDTDFDMEITDNVNAGTAHIKIQGKGKFNGTIENTFTIEPVPAKSLSFYADNTEFIYDGKPHTMHIEVRFGDTVLEEGRDYSVEYENNIDPGKTNAKLSFSGNFTGAVNIPFTIKSMFVNTSSVSSEIVNYTDKITVTASADGGVEPYEYAFYVRQKNIERWRCISDYSDKNVCSYIPPSITGYVINVKVRDTNGNIAEKNLPFSVKSTLKIDCKLSSDVVKCSQPVIVTTEMDEDPKDFSFKYLVRKTTEKKWTLLTKEKNLASIEYIPDEIGNYSMCIIVGNGKDKNTKRYLKFTVN